MDFKIIDEIINKELSQDIFEYIAKNKFSMQPYYNLQTGKYEINIKKRNSLYLYVRNESIKLKLLNLLKNNLNPNIEICSNIRIIKYLKNGYFKKHKDLIVNKNKKKSYTLILYLNDNYGGGNTILLNEKTKEFFKINKIENRILLFKPDIPHLGSKVLEGEKIILTTQIAY